MARRPLVLACIALWTAATASELGHVPRYFSTRSSTCAWKPALAFCAANALAFALAQDRVHVRDALAALACFRVAVYAVLVRYGFAAREGTPAVGRAATAAGGGASPGAWIGR